MPDLDRRVGGLRCRDVLAALPDYLDGELDPAVRDGVEAHLQACDMCEKFGGEYGNLVAALRRRLGSAAPDPAVAARLATRMARVWDE